MDQKHACKERPTLSAEGGFPKRSFAGKWLWSPSESTF